MNSISGSAHRRIVVLGTGGTIAGSGATANDNVGYVAGTISAKELVSGIDVPSGCEVEVEQVSQIDSKDMDFVIWQRLTERCEYWLEQPCIAGIVITHGTDTIEETSFFLQEVVSPRRCPIVLTCAMRPATALSPDGPQNLRDALVVAATVDAAGVVVVCAGEIHAASTVRKAHPFRAHAFDSGDAGPIGYVEGDAVRLVRPWPGPVGRGAEIARWAMRNSIWPHVEILTSCAGARSTLLDTLIRERLGGSPEAVSGVVLATTGNGSLHHELEKAAQRASEAGIQVWRSSRCLNGCILPRPNDQIFSAGSLSPVKARIALMLDLVERQLAKPSSSVA